MRNNLLLGAACLLLLVVPAGAQTKGETVEEVIARVNNEIITHSDLEHATAEMRDEVQRDCTGCTPQQVEQKLADGQKNILRDLIDNSLLVQRGKDLGINVDTQVVKRLDEVRIQNNLATMDDLERAVTKSGEDYEDFKNNIRDQLLQQEVIHREVGSRVVMAHADALKYYDQHKEDFVRPEQVVLRELFVSTEGKTDDEKEALKKKIDGLLTRIRGGDDFGELAKRFSDGTTAKDGGFLGAFEKNQLAANLSPILFKMSRNDVSDVIPTQNGYAIYQVQQHYAAGQQPEASVEDEILEHLYNDQLRPALRDYLQTLRQDSYVLVKPGYVDTAAVTEATIDEVPATPDDTGKKSKKSAKKKNGA